MMKQLKIGNVTLPNRYILGPMAGVTDLPFRVLCKEQGAGLLCMEMVSAKAILYNNKNTESLLEIHPDEQPVSLQFFGSDPKIMSEMAKRVEERPFDIMDINMGCPVPKVVRNGEGSALMKNPKLVYEIVSAMVKAIDKPVTVKIRKGFDDSCINATVIKSFSYLHSDRLINCLHHCTDDFINQLRILHKCRAFSIAHNLRHRTSHINIHNIKWTLFHTFCHLTHNLRI